jgi:phospholipase D
MIKRRSSSADLPSSLLTARKISIPSIAFILGFAVGSHFFDPLPPPLYQTPKEVRIQACFTPQYRCLSLITEKIKRSKVEILVQAYQLTSKEIAEALIKAHQRGVRVKVLVDKSQAFTSHSQLSNLVREEIEVLIDYKPHIAHNKIILIDKNCVIGGSYNFSEAAEYSNAENVLILENSPIIQEYYRNWENRYLESCPLEVFRQKTKSKK